MRGTRLDWHVGVVGFLEPSAGAKQAMAMPNPAFNTDPSPAGLVVLGLLNGGGGPVNLVPFISVTKLPGTTRMRAIAGFLLVVAGLVSCASPQSDKNAAATAREQLAPTGTPDGDSRLELSRFGAPTIASDHRTAPVNSLGYLRVMFAVTDIDDTLARLSRLGATVVDEVVNYENIYRLCYVRGPEGILIGLAEQVGEQTGRKNPMEQEG